MLPKPEACRSCPLAGDMMGFVPDRPVAGARVALVAQAPGEDEERGRRVTGFVGNAPIYEPCAPQPLVGRTGVVARRLLKEAAGLDPETVSMHNILKCRLEVGKFKNGKAKKVNKLPSGKVLKQAAEHCMREHLRLPPSVELVIAAGAVSWAAFGGKGKVSDWRGYLKPKEA